MDTDRVLEIALLAGEIIQSGSEIYRAEDTARIISESYGVKARMFLCQQGYLFQAMVKIKSNFINEENYNRTVDLHRIEMINGFFKKNQK